MAKKIKIPTTGISILSGEPGSGKSYKAVLMMIEDIKSRRPVYTNVPINIKAIRAYIRLTTDFSDDEIRNLPKYIKVVTKDHFDRFALRLRNYSQEYERLLNARDKDHNLSDLLDADHNNIHAQSVINVDNEFGQPKLTGGGADWIPHGASLYLDELHLWYKASDKNESPTILAYTSMHRHMLHKCVVLSQHPMQVSLAFRRMAEEYTFCRDWSKIPVLYFIKIPMKVFKYNTYSSMHVKGGEPDNFAKPTWSEASVPMFSGYANYRLYNSYSHAGDIKKINKKIEETRAMIEDREPRKESNMITKITRKKRFAKLLFKALFYSITLIVCMRVGKCGESNKIIELEKRLDTELKKVSADLETNKGTSDEKNTENKTKKDDAVPEFEITAITKSGAIIDGKFRRFGDYTKKGFTFITIKEEGRICIFVHDKTKIFMLVDLDGNVKYGLPKQNPKPVPKVPSSTQQSPDAAKTDKADEIKNVRGGKTDLRVDQGDGKVGD